MWYFSRHRPPAIVYALSLTGLLIMIVGIRIMGYDTWWHLTTGWIITNIKTIPHHDPFSYTAFGAPWVDHQWLYQAGMWLAYERLGVAGLTAMKFILLGATCFILFRTITYLASSRSLALWGTVVFLWGSSNRVMDRPLMVVMMMLPLYILILHKYARDGTRAIWILPPLQVLWINCHGGGIIGVLAIFAFALGETLQPLIGRGADSPPPIDRARAHRLWLVGLASLAACLINPWGAEIFVYHGQLRSMAMTLAYTTEWYAPLHPQNISMIPPYIYLACTVAALASFVLNARRARISHLLLAAGAALLLTRGIRFGPETMLINLPLLSLNLADRFESLRSPSPARSWINVTIVLALSVASLAFGVPTSFAHRPNADIGLSPSRHSAPAQLVDFLERNDIRGRVFNDMSLGAYLIFRRWPGELIYYDSRTPVYGEESFKEFIETFMHSRNFERQAERFGFDYIVLSGVSAWNLREMHRYLWENPEWKAVYAMDDGYVYLRDVPKFRGLIKRLGLKRHPIIEEMKKRGELDEDYR